MARPIVPPTGSPALAEQNRVDVVSTASETEPRATEVTAGHQSPKSPGEQEPPSALLPTAYRGKSSGEFQRVIPHVAPDTNGLIAEAELHLAKLPPSDRNRRLLEVAILRRDTALLAGVLEGLRKR